ncbi:MAG: endonuclease/exonuclease/phosphatase family protein [Kiloniellaceae bacterium]
MPDLKPALRVLTWNIHACVGIDGRHDVARVGRQVRALAPDLAAFQEVDSRRRTPGLGEVYDVLREEVGAHGHDAWALSGADGRYGQILASRFPLEERQVYDISVPGREPRKVMAARLRLPGMRGQENGLRVIATHLGLTRRERRRQLAALEEIIREDLSSPVLLLGDFNEWLWPRRTQRALYDLFDACSGQRSFPSHLPLFPLDRIWCRPGNLLVRAWAAGQARRASDHLPVIGELALATPR